MPSNDGGATRPRAPAPFPFGAINPAAAAAANAALRSDCAASSHVGTGGRDAPGRMLRTRGGSGAWGSCCCCCGGGCTGRCATSDDCSSDESDCS